MKALISSLLGLAVMFAIFAGIHYAGTDTEERQSRLAAFHLAPGDVQSIAIQPSLPGSTIEITMLLQGDPIDIYTMEDTWAASLAGRGLKLDRPFSYVSQWSFTNVSTKLVFGVQSDGETWHNILLDHTDNYYDNDAVPHGNVTTVDISTRFLAEEERSLMLGYIATAPSVLLVLIVTFRKVRTWRRDVAAKQAADES